MSKNNLFSTKVYKVTYGLLEEDEETKGEYNEFADWSSYNVLARDAIEAIAKANKLKNPEGAFATEVEILAELD
jgi:hypothetical protein